jgi:DNA excision repair protein ERCC-4
VEALSVPRIIADVHELQSGIPGLLEQRGVIVETRALPVADFKVGPHALVERKSVLDLHISIVQGRLWPQLGRLRRSSSFAYLLVEGADIDTGPLQAKAIRGACLAVIDLGISLLRSADAADSALWLERLAVRRQQGLPRDRPAYAQRPKRVAGVPAAEAALAAVPGISVVFARRLLSTFGTLERVLLASEEAWRSVPGTGPARAAALAAAFREPIGACPSRPSREGQEDPAT